jgi:hypothetical protein
MVRGGPIVRAVGALAIMCALVACSGSAQTTSGADSNTARIQSGDATLRGGLVALAELRRVIGLSGVRSVPLKGAPFFQDPDPRGFCGARVMQPDLSKGATTVFEADGVTVTDTVLRLDEATAKGFLDAWIADTRPGCPSFQSQTNTGATQTFVPGAVIQLPSVADQQTASTASITVNGQTGFVGEVLLRRGALISFGLIFAGGPVPAQTVQQFATTMNTSLTRIG